MLCIEIRCVPSKVGCWCGMMAVVGFSSLIPRHPPPSIVAHSSAWWGTTLVEIIKNWFHILHIENCKVVQLKNAYFCLHLLKGFWSLSREKYNMRMIWKSSETNLLSKCHREVVVKLFRHRKLFSAPKWGYI